MTKGCIVPLWIIVGLLVSGSALLLWISSGRDLNTLHDGLTVEFRSTAGDALDAQTQADLDRAVARASRLQSNAQEHEIVMALINYAGWSKALIEQNQKTEREVERFSAEATTAKEREHVDQLAKTGKALIDLEANDAAQCRKLAADLIKGMPRDSALLCVPPSP